MPKVITTDTIEVLLDIRIWRTEIFKVLSVKKTRLSNYYRVKNNNKTITICWSAVAKAWVPFSSH